MTVKPDLLAEKDVAPGFSGHDTVFVQRHFTKGVSIGAIKGRPYSWVELMF